MGNSLNGEAWGGMQRFSITSILCSHKCFRHTLHLTQLTAELSQATADWLDVSSVVGKVGLVQLGQCFGRKQLLHHRLQPGHLALRVLEERANLVTSGAKAVRTPHLLRLHRRAWALISAAYLRGQIIDRVVLWPLLLHECLLQGPHLEFGHAVGRRNAVHDVAFLGDLNDRLHPVRRNCLLEPEGHTNRGD